MKNLEQTLRGLKVNITLILLLGFVPFWVNAAIISVPSDQPTIQDAINAAAPGDTVQLEFASSPFVSGIITIPVTKTGLVIQGQGSTISSTSPNFGLNIQADNVTVEDLTVDGAGTFGIITGNPAVGGNFLTLNNVTVQNGGGTGFAITGVNDVTLNNISAFDNNVDTPSGNGGNGISLTSVQNVVINGYNSSGNMFTGGFSAGIGIFSSGDYTPCGTDNVLLTGNVNISEPVAVYIQNDVGTNPCGSNTVNNVQLNPVNVMYDYYMGIEDDEYYYTNLSAALTAADQTLATFPGLRPDLYVAQVSTGNKYVAPAVLASVDLSIQAAIDYSVDGDSVLVSAGTVTEGGQIMVDRDITIVGAGKNMTTLSPGFNTGTSGNTRGWFVVQTNVEFNMSDLTMDGTGWLVWQGVRHEGFGAFDNVAFNQIQYNASDPNYAGTAIAAFGNDNVDVTNSMFTNIGRVGVLYFGSGINGSLFQNNMYTGKGDGDFLDYMLDISNGAIVNVVGNTVSGNRGVASVDGSISAGILVSTFFGPGTEATITNNTITENTVGIAVGFDASDASTVTANNNDIFDNTDFGVSTTNPQVDATLNYWGDPSGPSGFGFGTGDEITDNVSFCPWLESSFTSGGTPVLGTGDVNLACNDLVHVSLDENCMAVLEADMLLEGEPYDNDEFVVEAFLPNGVEIPNATLDGSHLGMTITYHVTHECSGTTCWGELKVEDKLIPNLVCRDTVVEGVCGMSLDPEAVGFPLPMGAVAVRVPGQNEFIVSGFDPCGDVWLRYSDNVVKNGCGAQYYTMITRTWVAEDASGNTTQCVEELGVEPGDLGNVVFPPNYDGITRFALECDFKDIVMRGPSGGIGSMTVNIGWNSLDNGYPSPHSVALNGRDTLIGTGFPTGVECDHIAVTYRDRIIETCGPNTFKLFRSWRVVDWCTGEILEHLQLIKVVDNRAPQVICPPSTAVEIVPTSPWSCTGTYVVPEPIFDPSGASAGSVPVITQECSNWSYEVKHKVADVSGDGPGDCTNIPSADAFFTTNVRQLPNGQYEIFDMPFGCNWIEYIITDDCGNKTTCRLDVFVEDRENPVAVCDEHTVVSLNEHGEAKLCAQVVDNGSLDNCTDQDDLTYAIKRMGESDALFRDCIDFTCEDVAISPIMIVFRVYDERGNYNDCMVEAVVQDKIAPDITCPAEITLECTEDYLDDNLTGIPTTSDQCGNPTLSSEIIQESLNDCGIGFVIKRWRVEDAGGRFAICDQRINLIDSDIFDLSDIDWPDNVKINGCTVNDAHPDNLPAGSGRPEFRNRNCAKPVAGYKDDVFYNQQGLCILIKRTWEVIDWCQYDVINSTGPKWTMVQEIEIDNNEAPVIVDGSCEIRNVCANADCEGLVVYNLLASDDCTLTDDLEWNYVVRDHNTNAVLETGLGNTYSELLPLGRYQFTWTVKDACGNTDECVSLVQVLDCKEPTPVCKPGIVTTIMPTAGYVEIWASDFNDGSFDNCTDTSDLRYSFSADVNDTGRMIDCDDLAGKTVDTFELQMWVTDLDGNQDFCTVIMIVQDNMNSCDNTGNITAAVGGVIKTVDDEVMEEVMVDLMHLGVKEKDMMTTQAGDFMFDGLTMMDPYAVVPHKNVDHLNGVSTADLVMIQRHLLGITPFTSAYQYIAADANDSKDVSAADISEIRKLVLGINADFPKNTSWRFIDANQTFEEVSNPWLDPLRESIQHDPLDKDMMDDNFVGVKIGDVNMDAVPSGANSNGTRSNEVFTMQVEDEVVAQGESTIIAIEAGEDYDMSGIQLTMHLGADLEFVSVEGVALDMTDANYHYDAEAHVVTVSWGSVEALQVWNEEVLFEVNAYATADVSLSNEIMISSTITKAEVYNAGLEAEGLELNFKGGSRNDQGLTLYQNIPNPFAGTTVIPFDLPANAPAQLTIFDITGQVILVVHIEGKAGYNEFELSADQLSKSGVLYYQLESNQQVATKRMLTID